ncbi:uncharacterized protein BX664DRAFT_383909 [Halteromyces radiatus]|uniref:uncharacterized protein n=1 Tax=Halteromyces radiatus TaxID=101107 RepID=UPI00221F848C|nr:uncharacterized protein BX664DRAFT_383909 [Halteromyces radiatus]KAI8097659.1 hypothetical protein BX664DRAFT_383909 [Halteromyces radiatus]
MMTMDNSKESITTILDQMREALVQKEIENRDLKKRMFEWKKKALENESLYQTTIQQHQFQEQQLIAHHKAQMDALTAAHVEKMNDASRIILSLQAKQNDFNDDSDDGHPLSQSSACHHTVIEAESMHKESASKVIHHQKKASALILNINEVMTAIETNISDYIESSNSSSPDNGSDDDDDPIDIHRMNDDNCFTPCYSSLSSSSSSLHDDTPPTPIFSSPRLRQQQQQQQQQQQPSPHHQHSFPQLRSKPTMEHLSKVIPNFFSKPSIKSDQWKIVNRRSFIRST